MFKVYWMTSDDAPACQDFDTLTEALAHSKFLRDMGRNFVTMVSEDPNSVGKPGVDEVKAGVLPDGTDYTWRKRR